MAHGETSPGAMGHGFVPTKSQVQIMVMLRSDLFRECRARRINACPAPSELFRIVNQVTARHLEEVPFPLLDIVAVLAES